MVSAGLSACISGRGRQSHSPSLGPLGFCWGSFIGGRAFGGGNEGGSPDGWPSRDRRRGRNIGSAMRLLRHTDLRTAPRRAAHDLENIRHITVIPPSIISGPFDGSPFRIDKRLDDGMRAGPGRRPIRAPEMRYKEFFICALTDPVVALCFSLSRFSAPVARRGAKTGSRCKTGAAPATVSGERRSIRVTGPARDREGQTAASIREPGDLPRQIRPPAGCPVRPHAWLRPTLALRAHSPVRTRLPGALPLARCLKK